uniref:Auxin response factor 3 n=1 Tax=Rhizophora mucronata TaxID=61149 RepID=A0A2P2MQ02_RHIMU
MPYINLIKPSFCCIFCFKTSFEPHSYCKRNIKALQEFLEL